jgi:hypothetical protein
MFGVSPKSTPKFVVYIDEAGDPGLHKVKPADPDGASEWMTLGAVVTLAQHEQNLPQLVRDMRKAINANQSPQLHFRNLSDARKLKVCELIAERNIFGFAVCSHKPNMKGHRNLAAETMGTRGWFYNWCIRLLLERVTDFVLAQSLEIYGKPETVRLVFSERGGVKYYWLHDYLDRLVRQSKQEKLVLPKRDIKHEVIDLGLLEIAASAGSAGCQIADVFASSFYSAADALGSRWNTEPAKLLKPRMPKEHGFYHDYSVALQPSFFTTTKLSSDQKQIFEFYGYDFR